MDDHGVVGTIREAKFGVLLEGINVGFKQVLFLFAASVPDTAIVDEEALVHALQDSFDFVFANVAMDAAGGDTGVADGLGLLGDALGIVDASAVAKDEENPLKLHFGDAIGELTDKHTSHLRRGVCFIVLVIELDSFSGIGDERNISDEGAVEGAIVLVEVCRSIRSDQHRVESALEFDFGRTLLQRIRSGKFSMLLLIGFRFDKGVVLGITTHISGSARRRCESVGVVSVTLSWS